MRNIPCDRCGRNTLRDDEYAAGHRICSDCAMGVTPPQAAKKLPDAHRLGNPYALDPGPSPWTEREPARKQPPPAPERPSPPSTPPSSPRPEPESHGPCPRCGSEARRGVPAGGAYREARTDHRCDACGLVERGGVSSRTLAPRLRTRSTLDIRCLRCSRPLRRVVLSGVADRMAEVEHCPRCEVILVEPDEIDAVEALLGES